MCMQRNLVQRFVDCITKIISAASLRAVTSCGICSSEFDMHLKTIFISNSLYLLKTRYLTFPDMQMSYL